MKSLDIIGVSSGIIGIVFAVFTVTDVKSRIIISLIIIALLLIVKVVMQYIELHKLKKNLKELEKRHKALSNQYSNKEAKLEVMHDYWDKLGALLLLTKLGSQRERFKNAYDGYLELTAKIHLFTED